jgi:spore maturation protein CgeB
MRLAIIQNLYSNYITDFQNSNNKLLTSYEESLKLLQFDSFSWNGCWGEYLLPYNIEVVELYVNFDVLNQHWLNENTNISNFNIYDILIAQLNHFKIDFVLNTDVNFLDDRFMKRIKNETKVKKIYAHICSPFFTINEVSVYDGIYTCLKGFEEEFKANGMPSIYIPHCFNSKINERISTTKTNKINTVFFAGGVLKGRDLHDEREKLLLEFIKEEVPLEFYSEVANYNYIKAYLFNNIKISIYSFKNALNKMNFKDETLNKIPLFNKVNIKPGGILNNEIFKSAKMPLYGNKLFSLMQNQLISLNVHPGISKNEASNMRLFEATGVGSLLLTDHKDNLNSFFETDTEIVTYNCIEEAVEKAKYLLNNPSVALRIAEAGKKRVALDHTFYNRAPILADGLTKQFK